MVSKSIVLDANILIRAVLGQRVRKLIIENIQTVDFFVPAICLLDAHKYIPEIFAKRKLPVQPALDLLKALEEIVHIVDEEIYAEYQKEAKERMKIRDIDDWPIVATALVLNCPIWTEDKDFFGSGMSIWTTDRVHIYLEEFQTQETKKAVQEADDGLFSSEQDVQNVFKKWQ